MDKVSVAVFPGSFDPLTNGHVDVVTRALCIFDTIIVAVLSNSKKSSLFTVEERKLLISEQFEQFGSHVKVDCFSGLLVEYVKKQETNVIIRGLRAISDYEYEAQMALLNRSLSGDIETLFLMTREENSYISSSAVKEVALLGGDVSELVPPIVKAALAEKRSLLRSK